MSPFNNQSNGTRISLSLSGLVLIGLLISRFTGYDSLFSYRAPTLWTRQYNSWIMFINTFLQSPEKSGNLLVEWKQYISQSLINLRDKKLIQKISWEIQQLTTIELYDETKKCLDLFITWFRLLEDVKEQFLIASNKVINIEATMKQRTITLPTSSTKKCLELYIASLNSSKESLSLTYNNITAIESLYQKSLSWYKDIWWWFCSGVKEFIDSTIALQKSLHEVEKTADLVQKKLDSFDIQEYNTLCRYWWIQGIENLQKGSWSSKNYLDSFIINLKKTNNIRDYIKGLLPISWSWSLVNINNLK